MLQTFVFPRFKMAVFNCIFTPPFLPTQLPPGLVRFRDDHQPGPGADHFATLRRHQPGRDSDHERIDQLTVGGWSRLRQRQQRFVLILARFDHNNPSISKFPPIFTQSSRNGYKLRGQRDWLRKDEKLKDSKIKTKSL